MTLGRCEKLTTVVPCYKRRGAARISVAKLKPQIPYFVVILRNGSSGGQL